MAIDTHKSKSRSILLLLVISLLLLLFLAGCAGSSETTSLLDNEGISELSDSIIPPEDTEEAIIIVDTDSFIEKNFKKAGYESNPLTDETLLGHLVIEAPITTLTKEAVKDMQLDSKSAQKSKNMFALGMVFYMFNRGYEGTLKFFEEKFKSKPLVVEANKKVLLAGYNFANTIEAFANTYKVAPAPLEKGLYRNGCAEKIKANCGGDCPRAGRCAATFITE